MNGPRIGRYVISLAFLTVTLGFAFAQSGAARERTVQVSGSAIDRLDTAVIHSTEYTPIGTIQHSTVVVELTGDLKGRDLYDVTSVFDLVHGTLVNTGDNVFSGTIAGSAPVMVHDDQGRFNANLITGEVTGRIYLFDRIAGPTVRCKLEVIGTGVNGDGNPTSDYRGQCTFRGE